MKTSEINDCTQKATYLNHTKMKKFLLICLLAILTQHSWAQLNVAKLDSFFNQIDQHQKAMLSVTIMEKGRAVYQKSIGFGDREKNKKLNSNSVFRIGSISKMFTAVMIMQLVEEKKLDLNQHLSEFYPEFKQADKITLSNLLQHRSGLVNITTDTNYTDYQQMPQTQQEMVKRMAALGSEFEPGTQAKYSNTNFILLGYIIEKLTKATYETELQKRICKRIGLKNTYYGHKIQTQKSEVLSYEWNGESWDLSVETDMSIPGGAGAIVSTPTDLCTFINALFEGKLMKAETFAEMKKIQDGFGKGILQMPFGSRKAYGHNGSIDAFRSSLGYFEDDGMSFSIISNGRSMPQNDIALGLLSIYYGKPYDIPKFETIKLSDEVLSTYEGIYSNQEVGLKITIEKKNGQLVAQATGQGAIILESMAEDEFKFDPAKVHIKFKREGKSNATSFMLSQGGPAIEFSKEK